MAAVVVVAVALEALEAVLTHGALAADLGTLGALSVVLGAVLVSRLLWASGDLDLLVAKVPLLFHPRRKIPREMRGAGMA